MLAAARARRHGRSGRGARRRSSRRAGSRRCAPTCTSSIGDIARSLGDIEGAIAAYRHALELDPDFAVVRYQLARLLRGEGQLREAEQELAARARRGADVRRGDARARVAAPRAGAHATRRSTCSSTLLERDPYHFDALLALGETLLAIGRKRDAAHGVRARPALRSGARRRAVLRRRAARRPAALPRGDRAVAPRDRARAGERVRAPRAPRGAHGRPTCSAIFAARGGGGLTHGDRGTASRARHPRRLPAARPEPEDGRAARHVRAARRRGRRAASTAARVIHASMRSNPTSDRADPARRRARSPRRTSRARARSSAQPGAGLGDRARARGVHHAARARAAAAARRSRASCSS